MSVEGGDGAKTHPRVRELSEARSGHWWVLKEKPGEKFKSMCVPPHPSPLRKVNRTKKIETRVKITDTEESRETFFTQRQTNKKGKANSLRKSVKLMSLSPPDREAKTKTPAREERDGAADALVPGTTEGRSVGASLGRGAEPLESTSRLSPLTRDGAMRPLQLRKEWDLSLKQPTASLRRTPRPMG